MCRFDSVRRYRTQRTDITCYSVPHTRPSLTVIVDHINRSGRLRYRPLLVLVVTMVMVLAWGERLLRGLLVCVILPFSGILSVRRHGSVAQTGQPAHVVVSFVFFVFPPAFRCCRIVRRIRATRVGVRYTFLVTE